MFLSHCSIRPMWLLLACIFVGSGLRLRAESFTSKDATNWFEHASDQMNLRLPNSMPFHLRVKFHAFPGLELLPPDRTEILSGNGVYEETWLSQDRWRREVSLGSYHAIETQFG